MLDGIELTTPWETMGRIRRALKSGVKLWDGARFILADVPVNKREVKRILPWGMKPAEPARATLFITDYPKTAFTVAYKEAAVLIHVDTPLGRGVHCCWMVVDDDTALILGRENLGYPKKMADIRFEETEAEIKSSVSRRGARVMALNGVKGDRHASPAPIFDKKTFNVSGPGQMNLIHPIWMFRPKEVILESYEAEVSVEIGSSELDPLDRIIDGPTVSGRIAVSDIVGSRYFLPVGMAGPQWVLNTYKMRFK